MLAKHYDWKPLFEPVDYNPYLEDFYQDMSRWSFNLQIYFLNKRFKDVVSIGRTDDAIIQDRTIFEDAKIFAPNLHRMGMMSDRDFDNYTDLFELMMSLVELPDLMIYIRSSIPNLVSQIEKRGRDFEKTMRIDYLQGLNELYEGWISDYKGRLLIIEGDTLIPPFSVMDGLGDNVARQLVRAREEGEFLSKTELRKRGGLSSTLVEKMDDMGILGNMPEDNQLSLFDEFF